MVLVISFYIIFPAGTLKNREFLFSGTATGIIEYAIGNYPGISFAYLFQQLFG